MGTSHTKSLFQPFAWMSSSFVGFDPSDKKFVAVAIASGDSPPILVAGDRVGHNYREALVDHGAIVEHLSE